MATPGIENYRIGLNSKGHQRGHGTNSINLSGRNVISPKKSGYEYKSAIVVEVISDPKSFFSKKENIDYFYEKIESIQKNSGSIYSEEENLIHKIPKNSILCKLIDQSKSKYTNKYIVCYPFFSPHFSIPIKPGEHVWILAEFFDDFPRYYWISRKHGSYYNDNINISSHERESTIYNNSRLSTGIDAFTSEEIESFHDFPNSFGNDNFLLSDARKKEITNEPVPDFSKKSGDLVLQGSNNSLIHMTTEKFTPASSLNERYDKALFSGGYVNEDAIRTPMSPAIDICILRKKKHFAELIKQYDGSIADNGEESKTFKYSLSNLDSLSLIENTREGQVEIENYEVNKFDEDYFSNKDIDPSNCGSRLYMSNNCDIDEIFNILDTEKSQEIFQTYGGATLAGYSEHIRFIAEGESSSFRIVKKKAEGATFLEIDNDGMVNIGSKEGNVNSQNEGNTGLQPFVRGDDLETMLITLIDQISKIASSIESAGGAVGNKSPGWGLQHPGLLTASGNMIGIKAELNTIKENLPKFKSSLIKGE